MVPTLPTPSYGDNGLFAILAKTRVAATPLEILNVIRNTREWEKWNSFCTRCTIGAEKETIAGADASMLRDEPGWLEVGTKLTTEVFMSGDGLVHGRKKSREQAIVVTRIEKLAGDRKGFLIAWKITGWSHWQLHSERVMEFVELEDRLTEYVCWESFGGALARIVKATVGGTLVDRFGDYARDVKLFSENAKGDKVRV
ncbi:hypothetical protein BJ878DRAFT_481898 [Calycina marina]|uniref:Coenzyme Q-binding protein COQ10 START domain-containing protein n=1 Tax=Calycina marina TaxID=1763456 RepID=A0A9P8CER7_9HELO|nr:hypothetical protein BJ878DRAFT_481898 [Calycina marina]